MINTSAGSCATAFQNIAAHTIWANGTGLAAPAAQTPIGTTMAFDGTGQLQDVGLRDGGGVNHVTTGTWPIASLIGTDVSGNIAAEAQLACGQSEGPWTGDVTKAAGSCATTIPTKGKVIVSATDPTIDYLDTKFESTAGTISVSHIIGPPEFVNLNVITAGLYGSPQSATFTYNYLGKSIMSGFGSLWAMPGPINGADTDGNAYEMAVEFAPTAVRIVANVTCNTLSATGYSGVTFQATKNGSNITGAITPALAAGGGCPTPGIIRDSGAIAITASAGDRFGMLPSGSNTGGGVFSASVTLYVYQ